MSSAQQLAAAAEGAAGDIGKLGDAVRRQVNELSDTAGRIGEDAARAEESLRRQVVELDSAREAAETGLAAVAAAISERGRQMLGVTDQATASFKLWDHALQERSRDFAAAAENVTGRAREVVRSVDAQTRDLRAAAMQATTLTETLKLRIDEAGTDDFLRRAAFIAERLQSLGVDMNRLMETAVTEDDWRRYVNGERSVFVRKLLGFRERGRLAAIQRRFQEDGDFRGYVNRYMEQFDRLIGEARKTDRDGVLGTTFLSSDMGKVYMLLGRAIGRDS